MTTKQFQRHILKWYRHNRRDLPFRTIVRWHNNEPRYPQKLNRNLTPYHILVSEIMLQQTQIPRVLEKFPQFIEAFPNWETLARTDTQKLFKIWQGMGYWRRAKYLRECAGAVENVYGGTLPKEPEALMTLPGIGHYTAHAVTCFAYQNPKAFIDTNIRRVFINAFFADKQNVTDKEILPIAQNAVWTPNPREWHYALMDYGSLVLGNTRSLNKQSRHYARQSKFEGSFRSYRAEVIRYLTQNKKASQKAIHTHLSNSPYKTKEILVALAKDNIIHKKGSGWELI